METQPAICLLSGGIDSTTVLAIARSEGYVVHCLSFDYGQRHRAELAAAQRVAQVLGAASCQIVKIDLRAFGGSALTADIAVPKDRPVREMAAGIPVTYVPARNTIFLSYALAAAEVKGAFDLFIGVNAVDYSGYPDCRPEYIAAFETMANLATKAGVEGRGRFKIRTPLITLTKADIIRTGSRLGVDYGLTHSCYDPVLAKTCGAASPSGPGPAGAPVPPEEIWLACGHCDSCRIRRRGFEEAGIPDPTKYAETQMNGERIAK